MMIDKEDDMMRGMVRARYHLSRWATMLALCAIVVGQPWSAAQAAPIVSGSAVPAAELIDYEDPDGMFSISYPDRFTQQSALTYEMISDTPPQGLVASAGHTFMDSRNANGIVVLFLLLDQPVEDVDAFSAFVSDFQASAGGVLLPEVEFEIDTTDGFYALGSADNEEQALLMGIEAQGDVVAVLSSSLQQRALPRYLDDVTESLGTFVWSADNVRAALSGEPAPEPTAEPTPEAEATPESAPPESGPIQDDVAPLPEMERYTDPDGAFTLLAPVGLELRPAESTPAGYGWGFFSPDEAENVLELPGLGVSIVSAAKLLDVESEDLPLRPISDDEWSALIDLILEGFEDFEVVTETRDDFARTDYLVLDSGALTEGGASLRAWLWIEEAEGVLIFLLATGSVEPDAPSATEPIFHAAMAGFGWNPEAAKQGIIASVGMEPTVEPVAFDDPLEMVEVDLPAVYPFQAAYFDVNSLTYRFATTPDQGVVTLSFGDFSEQGFSDEEWEQLVAEIEPMAVSTLADNELGAHAEAVSTEIGVPEVESGHSALVRGQSDTFQSAVLLQEQEGVLATFIWIVPNELWTEHESEIETVLHAPVGYDPAVMRDALSAYNELEISLLGSAVIAGRPVVGAQIAPQYVLGRDDIASVVAAFGETELSGSVNMTLWTASLPDTPAAVYNVDVSSEAAVAREDFIVRQDEEGTRVAFVYDPHFSLTPDTYTAMIDYNTTPIVVQRFTVANDEPVEAELTEFGVYAGDTADNQPLVAASVVNSADSIHLRGTGNMPAGTLRLFWYDGDNRLITDDLSTIRLKSDSRALEDWFYFAPFYVFQPGDYHYLLTLDGYELESGSLTVLEDAPNVALDAEGADFFAALPLPAEVEIAEPVEGIDLAVAPTTDFTTDELYATMGAWLRQQGWSQTLPALNSPQSPQYQRWVKDDFQFLMQPGTGDAADQVWMQLTSMDDPDLVPPPLADTPITPDNLLQTREVGMVGIASDAVTEAVMSPDGHWLALVSEGGQLALLNAHTLLLTQWWDLPEGQQYHHPSFDASSRRLAVAVDGDTRSHIQLFDSFEVVWLPTTMLAGHEDAITGLVSGPGLVSAAGDATLRVWDGDAPTPIALDGPAVDIATPDFELLLAALEGGQVQVWEPESMLYGFDTPSAAPQLAVSPVFDDDGVGDLLVTGDGVAEWWRYGPESAELLSPIPVGDDAFVAHAGAVSPDGALMTAAGTYVVFYDRITTDYLADWTAQTGGEPVELRAIAYSPDGDYLLAVTVDGSVRLLAVAPE
jgi:hypothetical protein